MLRYRSIGLALATGWALAAAILASGCSSHPRRDPTGEPFPSVQGTSLDGVPVTLPDEFRGEPLLLLVGYEQEAQFDLDRWLFGLDQAGWRIRTFEVPTLPGLFPRLLQGTIDGGMRRGIPQEDWASVITVYGDGDRIAAFTGDEDGLTGRVLLLDREGNVAFFHDRGYSVGTLQRLREVADGLAAAR